MFVYKICGLILVRFPVRTHPYTLCIIQLIDFQIALKNVSLVLKVLVRFHFLDFCYCICNINCIMYFLIRNKYVIIYGINVYFPNNLLSGWQKNCIVASAICYRNIHWIIQILGSNYKPVFTWRDI